MSQKTGVARQTRAYQGLEEEELPYHFDQDIAGRGRGQLFVRKRANGRGHLTLGLD